MAHLIAVGEKIPLGIALKAVEVTTSESGEAVCGVPKVITTEELFGDKKVVLFGVPGAFTPTCSEKHLPGFVNLAANIKGKGVDQIACIATNDAFVMSAWGRDRKVGNNVLMLADGNGELVEALGLAQDLTKNGFGKVRSKRFALIADKGVVSYVVVEQPGKFEDSTAEAILAKL